MAFIEETRTYIFKTKFGEFKTRLVGVRYRLSYEPKLFEEIGGFLGEFKTVIEAHQVIADQKTGVGNWDNLPFDKALGMLKDAANWEVFVNKGIRLFGDERASNLPSPEEMQMPSRFLPSLHRFGA